MLRYLALLLTLLAVPAFGQTLGGGTIGIPGLTTDGVLERHLKAVDSPSDEECLTYEATVGDFEWQPCSGGSVTDVTGTAPITSSGGTTPAIGITAATTGAAGSMSGADKTKLDGIETLADVTDATNVAAAGAMFDLVEDTTPQAGGPFDVNGNEIVGSIDIHSDDDVILELGDNIGVNKVSVRDSDGNEVASIDSDGTIAAHDIHLTHTATGDDQHTANITTDGAGFGDIKSLDIDYTTGDLQSGDDSAVVLINIDESGASGGEVFAVQVLASENNVTVTALKAGESVGVIRQASGTFGDMDSFLIIAANMLTEALSAAPADLPYFLAQGDTITIADAAKFTAIEFVISTGASANGIVPTFEFWNGSSWIPFTPIDGTDGWRETGAHQVSWDLTDVSTWAVDGNTEYPIQITRTKITLITDPVGSQVQIAASTVYGWNKDGDVNIRQLTLSGAANFQDNTLSRTILLDTGIVTQTLTGTGNQTIDLESGNSVKHVAFGAIDWNFVNPPAQPALGRIDLSLITGGTGTQTFTNVIWESGSAPVLLDTQQDFTTDFGTDDKLDITAHGFINGERVHATTTGTLSAGLDLNIVYYVINKTDNDFEVSLTLGGAAVDIADDGTGTHTIHSGENRLLFTTDVGGIYWVGRAPVSTGINMAGGNITMTGAETVDGRDVSVDGATLDTLDGRTIFIVLALSDETTDLTAATTVVTFRMPYGFTLTDVRISLTTAPTDATVIVDINEDGATILSTKLSIDATEKTSTTAVSAVVIDDAALADDAEITFDIDQIGSTIAGTGLKIYLIGNQT